MLTGNIVAASASVVDAQNNPLTTLTAGEQLYIHVDFTTQDLPSDVSYRIGFRVNGLTLDSGELTWGAGSSGTANWYAYWGTFIASPGANQVTVTLDPDQSVPETSYSDNTVSFAFDAAAPAVGTFMSYTVAQMRAAYGLNSVPNFGAAAADGSGQTIALVEAGNEPGILTDLDGFDQAMSLTTTSSQTLYQQYGAASSVVSVYNQFGSNITGDISDSGSNGVPVEDPTGHWEAEETMDVEWAHAIAPGAKIDIVEVNDDANWAQNLLVGDKIAANLPGVSAVSNSWGLAEESNDTNYDSSTFVTPSGHTGVTFLTASNDNGANVYGAHGSSVGGDGYYPATSPNVVSVGGTELALDNNVYGSETGWSYPVAVNAIENGSSAYSQSGTWTSQSGGFGGTYSTAAGGSSSSASWTIPITPANTGWGTELSATWTPSPSNATKATYTIYDGTQASGTLLGTVSIDQTKVPSGTVDGSSQFQELGVFFPALTSGVGTLTVVLNADSANGTAVADAIGAAQAWASTGGPSLIESEPSYQATFQKTGYRTTPDVSFDASQNSGVTCYQNGSLTYGNMGTSLGSPCWAGLIAIVNQGRIAVGGTTLNSSSNPQQALEAIYSLPAGDFHDITSGYNGFSAAPGYDVVTGRGSPIADRLIPDLVAYPLSSTAADLTPPVAIAGMRFTNVTVFHFADANPTALAGDFTATVTLGDGNQVTVTGTAGSNGQIVASPNGGFDVRLSYTYAEVLTGKSFGVSVADAGGASTSQNGTLTVMPSTPFNGAVYTIGSGTIALSAVNGLLVNDNGSGQFTVTASTVTGDQDGRFAFNADGSFTYTPGANFPGYDSAPFTVSDASGDKATQTVTVLSQHAAVVWKFYESVLNRTPDPAGLQYWTNYFNTGGQTGQMAVGFFESTELLDKIITNYYQQYLLRTPDASGLVYWVSQWQGTGEPEGIKAGFADSPEFYSSAGGTPGSWLAQLYQRILDRAPDAAGYQFWLNYYNEQLAAGVDAGSIQQSIALGFFTATEAYGDDVTGWFNEYLGRNPTSSEQTQYVYQMQAGATDRTIEQEITNLPEYATNPPAPADGTAALLPDYYPIPAASASSQTVLAAKAEFFSQL